ncbi:hypothetical protein I2483_12695 [Sporosarcina sp. E16_3]|uniref:hypothetical protein n=1 Tax=Sporosarcina sp. E16_3 TaxID=2789293 RepID=UPI001A9100F4|nr:hypothetical protein [Sporosarcina sp. E16_3]MBO0602518.1 hypothetical protein [Sporosarcina sp. E16_3]
MVVLEANGTKHSVGVMIADMLKNYEDLDNVGKFSVYAYTIQMKFTRFVIGISPSEDTVFVEENVEGKEIIEQINLAISGDETVKDFAIAKYYLEKLFFEITEKGRLIFHYRSNYLVSSSAIRSELKVSRATIMRYVENGMEKVKELGHKCYPKHNALYWKDGVWVLRIQALQEKFKLRNQCEVDLITEIEEQIKEYEKQYGGLFKKVFADIVSGEVNIYDLEEPDDYKDWRDLLKDLERIRGKDR